MRRPAISRQAWGFNFTLTPIILACKGWEAEQK